MEDKGKPLSQTSEIWVKFQDFTYDLFRGLLPGPSPASSLSLLIPTRTTRSCNARQSSLNIPGYPRISRDLGQRQIWRHLGSEFNRYIQLINFIGACRSVAEFTKSGVRILTPRFDARWENILKWKSCILISHDSNASLYLIDDYYTTKHVR